MVHNSYYQYPDGVAVQGAWSVLAVPMVRPTSLKLTPYAINTTREWLIASPKVHTDVEIPDVSLSRLHGGMTKTGDDTETIGFPSIGFNGELLSQGSDLH